MRIVLASQSPARLATLRSAGIEPEVVVSGVDEDQITSTDAGNLAAALAQLKCRAVAAQVEPATPSSSAATRCWRSRARSSASPPDRSRRPAAGAACAAAAASCTRATAYVAATQEFVETASTIVHFADITDAEIDAYVATGEPLHVAGAFTIDGLGGAFVTGIEGDHHNVVGLSLPLLRDLVGDLGIAWTDLWSRPNWLIVGHLPRKVREWTNDGNLTAATPLPRIQSLPGRSGGGGRGLRGRCPRLARHLRPRSHRQPAGHAVGPGRLRRAASSTSRCPAPR